MRKPISLLLPLLLLAAPAAASTIDSCPEPSSLPALQQVSNVTAYSATLPHGTQGKLWAKKIAETLDAMPKKPIKRRPPKRVKKFIAKDPANRQGPYRAVADGHVGIGVFRRDLGVGGTWYVFTAKGRLAGKIPGVVPPGDQGGLDGPDVPPPFLAAGTGAPVTLGGLNGTTLTLSPELTTMLGATPTGWPLTAAAFRLPPAPLSAAIADDTQRTELLDNAFAAWLGGTGNPFAIAATRPIVSVPLADAPSHYYHMLADNIGGDWAPADAALNQKNMLLLGKSLVADGATDLYEVHYDNQDDTDYTALVSVNRGNGEVRVLGYRDDP